LDELFNKNKKLVGKREKIKDLEEREQ